MKINILYGSTTGNAQSVSEKIAEYLIKTGHEVSLDNVLRCEPASLIKYDVIILGCSTWGDGILQDDFVPFEEKMKVLDLSGKKAAVFGSRETAYPQFCKGVDILEDRLEACGAEIIGTSLKIDGDVDIQEDRTLEWIENIAGQF